MAYIGNTPADKFLTLEKQTFTTSATDTYTLDREVSSVNDLELFLNNVRQEPTEAYTISGTTLTLASAITSSDSLYCVYQGRAVGTQAPATGSVTNGMLAGSIANSKLANSSITLNGSAVSLGGSATITEGITVADEFRLTTNFTNNATPISSNLERIDGSGQGTLGTGMTESSGVFTFPSTGIYYVSFDAMVAVTGSGNEESDGNAQIHVTTDNSTYHSRTGAKFSLHYNNVAREASVHCHTLIDVTDTSNVKVRFHIDAVTSAVTTRGNTNSNQTYMTFIRLGDT